MGAALETGVLIVAAVAPKRTHLQRNLETASEVPVVLEQSFLGTYLVADVAAALIALAAEQILGRGSIQQRVEPPWHSIHYLTFSDSTGLAGEEFAG